MHHLGIVRAILLCLVLIVARFYCLNEAMFHRQRGKYLSNRVIRTQQLNSEFECSISCSTEPSCASLNYKSTGDGQGLCELNNETLSDPPGKHGMDIPEFIHLGIVKRVSSVSSVEYILYLIFQPSEPLRKQKSETLHLTFHMSAHTDTNLFYTSISISTLPTRSTLLKVSLRPSTNQ